MKWVNKIITFLFVIGVVIPLTYYASVLLNKKDAESNVAAVLDQIVNEDRLNLLSYAEIKADYDDGCVCAGHVNLTFEVDENPMEVRAIFTLGPGNQPKQICALAPSGEEHRTISEISAWNEHVCWNR